MIIKTQQRYNEQYKIVYETWNFEMSFECSRSGVMRNDRKQSKEMTEKRSEIYSEVHDKHETN